ncbi:DNRLRE domain-containing protein [[Actinomadura] parvosata]|nr:DNRLRE domain-containing protein [Nonomuraea sp. ATCC 55076]
MTTRRLAPGLSTRTRRRGALIAALTLPLSLMSAPAIAQGPTPPPSSAPGTTTATTEPTLKAAWDQAVKTGKPVEVPTHSTETMKVWANPDGKNMRAELHTRPVQLKNAASGAWEPIDTRIVTRDGKLQATRVKTPLTFGGRGAKQLVSAPGKHGEIGLGVTRALPEPKVSGNAVTYPDAVAPGADLVVLAQADGFISQVVFRQRPTGPVTVRLPLTLPEGTTFGKTPQGLPQLKDAKGKAKAAPIVLTATDALVEAAPDQGRTHPVKAQVETTGKTSELVFTPDETFLADPAVTYPVTVAASSTWFGGGAPDDAWISKNDPYNNNSAAGYLRAGTTSTSADVARVYMKFNTSDPVLQGATVNDADLRIWNYKSGGPNGQLCGETMGAGIRAARVTGEWTLDGTIDSLDWYNQPSSTAPETVNKAGYNYDADPASWCAKDEELFYEVTAMTRAWIQQGEANHGIVLKAASETAAINWRQYYSSQFGGGSPYPGYRHPPALIITYTPAPVRTTGFMIPYKEIPTVGDARDNSFPSTEELSAPLMTEDEVLAARESVPFDYSMEDSQLGLATPDDLTPEQWEEAVGATFVPDEVGRWKFNEGEGSTAVGTTPAGHDATLGSGTRWVAGKSGSALSNAPMARIAAAHRAVQQGKPVEVPEETSETSITYAQADGKTFSTEITAGPARTKQNGSWVPIDTSLSNQDGVLRPKAIKSGIDVKVSNGGESPFLELTDADGERYALSWPTPLPVPSVKGGVVTYADAAGKGADLVVTVLPTGFRHDVVLRERPAKPLELSIGVETTGLTLDEGKGGRLLLKDKAGKIVASASQPTMWEKGARGVLPGADQAKVSADVVTKDGRTELVLKPDHRFLTAPDTVYPVRVDPTVALPLNHDVEVNSDNDADWPADPTAPFLLAGTQTGGYKYRVHLRFDTAAVAGSTVTDAKLSMNTIDAQNCGATVGAGIQVARLTSAWDPDNVHWANKPALTTEDASTNTKGVNEDCATWPDSMEWNVTGIAQDWASGAANHGLVLKSPGEANVSNYRVFTSAEDTDFASPPKLIITSSAPASSPTVSGPTITPSQVVNGTTMVGSLTPQLAATVADTAPGALIGQFEVEHDPTATGQGTGQIWAGDSATVTSGGQAIAAVPVEKLSNGWKIRWRVRAVNATTTTTSAWSEWQSATVAVATTDPAVGTFEVIPSQLVNGKTVTTSLTPTLRVVVNGPEGQPLRAEFEVEHDPAAAGQGSGQIWTGAVDGVVSGGQAGVSLPEGTLSDGWSVRWRARAIAGQAASPWADWQPLTVNTGQGQQQALATTARPVIRTDQSFTVAAWLRWSDKDGSYSVFEQKGTYQAPFLLGNDPEDGLVFTFTSADASDAAVEGVVSGVEPPVDGWFHLAGSYDATTRTATLYLNGTPVKSQVISFPTWDVESAMSIGARMQGDLDEVHMLQRPLAQEDVVQLYTLTDLPDPSPDTSRLGVAAAASRKFPYNRLTHEDCATAVGKPERPAWEAAYLGPVRRAFHYKNSYNMCYAMWIGERDEDNNLDDEEDVRRVAKWYGRLTLVFHTHVGKGNKNTQARDAKAGINSRQIKVWARLDEVNIIDSDWGSRRLNLGLGQNGLNCKTTYVEGGVVKDGTHGRTAKITDWAGGGDFEFTLSVPWDGLDHPDKVGTCAVQPFVRYIDNPDITDLMWYFHPRFREKKHVQTFICDSADWIAAHAGGCIVGSVAPIFILNANDTDRGKKSVEKSVENIYTALYDPQNSKPNPPGWPTKKIPGGWNINNPGCNYVAGQPGGCLHRTRDTEIHRKNRSVAIPACTTYDRAYSRPDSCDEYPFATTLEGAGSGTNYSVKVMHESDNCSSGSRLSVFYQRNRIRERSPFWVDVIQLGHSRPASGAPGIVATEALYPEEISDFRGCSIDGVDNPIGPN